MRRAYTLVEMLVTVAVLALLASFVVPTYQLVMSQMQLGSAADEVAGLLRTSEQKTVTEQQLYGVTFTEGATTIPQYIYNQDGSKTSQPTFILPANIKIGQVNFSGVSDVRFTTSGAPNVSGSLVLTDTIRNRSRRVDIKPSGAIFTNQSEF